MRTPPHEQALSPNESGGAERRCILTRDVGARGALLRLAIAPDGAILPDVLARAPGRGAWIGVDKPTLAAAIAKGKLQASLARAFKGAKLHIPADLPDQVEAAFARTLLAQLGLATRAGVCINGAERVDVAARSGQVALLAHASDAAEDGRRKRDASWRIGMDEEGSGRIGTILPFDRIALASALGRDNVVHLAITDKIWAGRILDLLGRWQDFGISATGRAGSADASAPERLSARHKNDADIAAAELKE